MKGRLVFSPREVHAVEDESSALVTSLLCWLTQPHAQCASAYRSGSDLLDVDNGSSSKGTQGPAQRSAAINFALTPSVRRHAGPYGRWRDLRPPPRGVSVVSTTHRLVTIWVIVCASPGPFSGWRVGRAGGDVDLVSISMQIRSSH